MLREEIRKHEQDVVDEAVHLKKLKAQRDLNEAHIGTAHERITALTLLAGQKRVMLLTFEGPPEVFNMDEAGPDVAAE